MVSVDDVFVDCFFVVVLFYGLGIVVVWLCILLLFFIMWCFNVEYFDKDIFSFDYVFIVVILFVVFVYVFYQIFLLLEVLGSDELGVRYLWVLFISQELEIL